ncbi:hypothetical protein V6N11_033879 [Hibiscus sabdariffa]|uniref:Uncharacterized protein n=1 Tax=Hibiscus sabdariffa TaxID=183260 RepID=A0ABR2S1C8_9ROSI
MTTNPPRPNTSRPNPHPIRSTPVTGLAQRTQHHRSNPGSPRFNPLTGLVHPNLPPPTQTYPKETLGTETTTTAGAQPVPDDRPTTTTPLTPTRPTYTSP